MKIHMSTATMAKERPILFSAPMVRAILEGRKTQTRWIVKPQSYVHGYGGSAPSEIVSALFMAMVAGKCPYGAPGDRLWVRETWTDLDNISMGAALAAGPSKRIFYAADGHVLDRGGRWKPSIHMPRAHSRIVLEMTGVRVERLQEISEEDAKAEGCHDGTMEYEILWNSINADRAPWSSNPWVWVISFLRIAADAERMAEK